MPDHETEFKLGIPSEAELEAIIAVLGNAPAHSVRQVNHFFDTTAGDLRARHCSLRLRQEDERFLLTAKGPSGADAAHDALASRAEIEHEIAADEAAAILSGRQCPLALLLERAREPRAAEDRPAQHDASGKAEVALLDLMAAARDGVRLEHFGSFCNVRRRLGPVPFSVGSRSLSLVFEFDRTEFPGDRIDYEVEVEIDADDADAASEVIRDVLQRAGVAWKPMTNKLVRFHEAVANS